jgi:hypothetical protein
MWRADKIQEKLGWEPGIPKLFSRRMNVRDERARHGAARGEHGDVSLCQSQSAGSQYLILVSTFLSTALPNPCMKDWASQFDISVDTVMGTLTASSTTYGATLATSR